MEIKYSKTYEMQQSSFKREVHSNAGLPQEIKKKKSQITLHLRKPEKEKNKQSPEVVERNNRDQSGNK